VRQGASWTAAYHRQLTVGAVARPIRGSVWVPPEFLRLSGPGGCSPRRRLPEERPAALERSGVVAVVDTASRQATASIAGVSSMRCPPIRSWRPGSGCPAVRCPVTWGRRPEGPAVGRLLSTRPVSSCPVSTRAVSSRLVSAPVHPDASVSSHSGGGGGTRSSWPGDPDHRDGWRPLWLPGRRRLDDGPGGRDAGDAAAVARWSRGVGGGPGSPGWVRAAAVALARRATRQARPACGAPVAGGGAVGTGAGCRASWPHPPPGWRPGAGGATTVGGRR
jgi:hypothetical protein